MRKFLYILLIVCQVNILTAQISDPVKWQYSIENLTIEEADILFTAHIEQGWAMYSTNIPDGPVRPIPTSFSFEITPSFELSGDVVEVTKPAIKHDPTFKMDIGQFKNIAIFRQKIKLKSRDEFILKTTIEYMCCNETSCLPPAQTDLDVKIPTTAESKETQIIQTIDNKNLLTTSESEEVISPTPVSDDKETSSNDSSLWGFFLMALSSGLLGVLTPCVYPMIPMTVSFFMRDEKKRSKGAIKALIFGGSIILIYTSVGVLVALTKRADLTNQIVAHWLTNLIFAGIFIIFALSFFGLFEITLPSSLANRIDQKADKGGYLSAFFMALALVVISFSCTGPFVGGILVTSAQGLAIKPILGMFGFGLAFALPFTFLAFFPSLMKKLPKSGGWMNSVKVVFAFIMLAFAVYFLSYADKSLRWDIFTRDVFLCIWIVLFSLMGCYLLGKIRFAHDSEVHYVSVTRLFLSISSFVFALYLFTGLLGAPLNAVSGLLPAAKHNNISQNTSALKPIQLCDIPKYSDHSNLSWPHGLQGYFDYDQALACAKEQQKPVLLIFKGHTCAKCMEMESSLWPNSDVLNIMNDKFILLALYTDDTTPLSENEYITSSFDGKVKKTMGQKNADLQITRYNINSIPYHVILDDNGKTLAEMGYTKEPDEFLKFLQK